MVKIAAIRAANSSISARSITAVFIGATSGIGLATVEALLTCTTKPKVFIIGRSQSNFASTLARLQDLNESVKVVFIEAQVSLLQEVDRVCTIIKTQEPVIDLLWLSQGGLSLAGHGLTSEGITSDLAVKYYSRMLFIHLLMPLLNKSSDPRTISVLSAGQEGSVNNDDIGLTNPKNYSFVKSARQGVSMTSVAMKAMSLENPKVSFIHTQPGMVKTAVHSKLADTMTGYLTPFRWLLVWVLMPIMHLLAMAPEEAGQVGLYEFTDGRFHAGTGKNFFRLWQDAEELGTKPRLSRYEENGTQKKVWEHTLQVFDRVLSR